MPDDVVQALVEDRDAAEAGLDGPLEHRTGLDGLLDRHDVGRGTMTSLTIVSPNSMIEWISTRSSLSMASSRAATSAKASSSDSVTSGSVLLPARPG